MDSTINLFVCLFVCLFVNQSIVNRTTQKWINIKWITIHVLIRMCLDFGVRIKMQLMCHFWLLISHCSNNDEWIDNSDDKLHIEHFIFGSDWIRTKKSKRNEPKRKSFLYQFYSYLLCSAERLVCKQSTPHVVHNHIYIKIVHTRYSHYDTSIVL